jgi:hypothetical protein
MPSSMPFSMSGVAADELHGRTAELIGKQERRLLVAQIGDHELP